MPAIWARSLAAGRENSRFGALRLPASLVAVVRATPWPARAAAQRRTPPSLPACQMGSTHQLAADCPVGIFGRVQVHNQYIITYNPNNKNEGGLHQIRVEVTKPGLEVRTRRAYWMAAVQ